MNDRTDRILLIVLTALIGALLWVGVAEGQEALCPLDVTATGGDRWQVLVADSSPADSLVSEHSTYYTALEVAARVETEDPSRAVEVAHRAYHRVECPEDWTPPSGGVDTVQLAATDTLRSPYPVEAVGDSTGVLVTWQGIAEAEGFQVLGGLDDNSWAYGDTAAGGSSSATLDPPAADTARGGWVCVRGLRAGVLGRRSCHPWTIPALPIDSLAVRPDSVVFLYSVADSAPADTSWRWEGWQATGDSMVLAREGAGRTMQVTALGYRDGVLVWCAGYCDNPAWSDVTEPERLTMDLTRSVP